MKIKKGDKCTRGSKTYTIAGVSKTPQATWIAVEDEDGNVRVYGKKVFEEKFKKVQK
jgi:hypothetical protein